MNRIDRLVFFGTPEFAVPTLRALVAASRVPVLVVSQPSRAAGRGRSVSLPPVAAVAEELGLQLVQPRRVRDAGFIESFERLRPDVAVVAAFGQIFPRQLLVIPRFGCINLHASLLPAYRGASPVTAAIAAGDTETGVTTMVMEEGLDTGPMLLRRRVAIADGETGGELTRRLAELGADLVVETLGRLERGDLEPTPQNDDLASYAPRLKKTDGIIDWRRRAHDVGNRLRAFTPWPGATTTFRAAPLRIVEGRALDRSEPAGDAGTFLGLVDGTLAVRCGDGSVFGIERLQRPGRRVVDAVDFANGEKPSPGELLGQSAVEGEGSGS